MNPKNRFQLSIVGLTVVLIGGLTGAFMNGMFLFLDHISVLRVLAMLISLAIGLLALWKMIALNRKEIKTRVDGAVNDYHEYIDRWIIEPEQWKQFLKQRFAFDQSESRGYGYAAAGVFTFLIALIGSSVLSMEVLLAVLAGSFLFFFVLGKWGSLVRAKRRFRMGSAFTEAQVHFAEKLIVFNGQLIMLSDFGVKLKSFQIEHRFGMTILSLKIETGFGQRQSFSSFLIPVPNGKEGIGEILISHYRSLIDKAL